MPTGLKLSTGTQIKTANLSIQAVESDTKENVQVASISKGATKTTISAGFSAPTKKANFAQFNTKFTSPNVTLPVLPAIPQGTQKKTAQQDVYQTTYFATLQKPIEFKGISNQRPEIISLVDFQPIYENVKTNTFNSVGEMLEFQIAARKLRVSNIKKLIWSLSQNDQAKEMLDDLLDSYQEQLSLAREELDFFVSMFQVIDSAKNSFKLKKISVGADQSVFSVIRSIKQLLIDEFSFSEKGVSEFSNSKVFGQFLFDISNVFLQYSPSLFNSIDIDRLKNEHPTLYSQEIDLTDGKFKFRVEDFRSTVAVNSINMGNTTTFTGFLNKLPTSPDDRLKLLISVLSKEMRISQGLGRKSVNKILSTTFGSISNDRDNPFDEIVGKPGKDITDPINGDNTLCSLLRLSDDDNVVLPFESAFVVDELQRAYIPGTTHLFDSILQGTSFQTSNLNNYKKSFEKKAKDSITVINELLNLKDQKKTLWNQDIFDYVVNDFISILDGVIKSKPQAGNSNTIYPGEYVLFAVALMAIANSDLKLKSQLFQFMLLTGFAGTSIGEIGVVKISPFFEKLSNAEIKTLGQLTELNLGSNPNLNNLTFNNTSEDIPNLPQDELQLNKDTPTNSILSIGTALELLLTKIVDRLFALVKNGLSELSSGLVVPFTKTEIRSIISSNRQIFNYMIQCLISFDEKIVSDNGYALQDASFKSRLNFLTPSTRAVMVFEMYSAFCKKYIDVGFRAAAENNKIEYISGISLRDILSTLKNIVGNASNSTSGGLVATPKPAGQQGFAQSQGTNQDDSPIYYDSLKSLRDKLIHEDSLMIELLNRLQQITDKINLTSNSVIDFFNPNGANSSRFTELSTSPDAEEKISLMSEAQVRLGLREIDDLEPKFSFTSNQTANNNPVGNLTYFTLAKSGDNQVPTYSLSNQVLDSIPVFLDDSEISLQTRELLFNVLGKSEFRINEGKNVKILSVGLPAGFSENLHNFVGIKQKDFDEIDSREKDVIQVNVYRRDIEFEDIVFKPQKFIFELSRFVSKSSVAENITTLLQSNFDPFSDSHVFMRDYSKLVKGTFESKESVFESERYDFLSENQKSELVKNHLVSYVLEVYVKLLTGISLDETEYIINDYLLDNNFDEQTKKTFKKLIETYVSGLANIPITLDQLKNSSPQIAQLLNKIDVLGTQQSFIDKINPISLPGINPSTLVQLTEDLISFIKVFNPKTILTGGFSHRQRITSPKMFERIFNLAVDPDNFEIDVVKTNASKSGQVLLQKLIQQRQTITKKVLSVGKYPVDGLFIKPTSRDDIDFEQFFVNVSTVGNIVI